MRRLRPIGTIAANDFYLLWRDPIAPILLVVMPLVVAGFIKPAFGAVLRADGHGSANGAEQVVPGMALMFVFFMVSFTGIAFFREHIWATWDRVRALPLGNGQILIGKILPPFTVICAQQLILFVVGGLILGLHVKGPVSALVVVDVSFSLWLTSFIVLTIAVCRTLQQVLAVSNLGAIAFAGIGGALVPISTLPGWAEAVAPLTPTYWAMRGFNSVLLDGDGMSAVLLPAGVLLGATVVLGVAAAVLFRFDAEKGGTI
jgi:ABC-2 type transport system permease protein